MTEYGISRIRKLVLALSSALALGTVSSCATSEESAQGMSNELETEGAEVSNGAMEAGDAAGKKMKKRRKKMGKKMQKKMKKMKRKKMKKMKKATGKAADEAGNAADNAMDTDGF